MATLKLDKILNFGLYLTLFSQFISYLSNHILLLEPILSPLKLLRVLIFLYFILVFIFTRKFNYLFLIISSLLIYILIGSFIVLKSCCFLQYISGFLNFLPIYCLLIILINPFSQLFHKQITGFELNFVRLFFYSNILVQIIQSFSTGSAIYGLKISIGPIGLWIRSLGFFDIPSTTALASLSIICFLSKEQLKNKTAKNLKNEFTIKYFLPCAISIFLAASGTAIIGLFLYIYYARNLLILDFLPNLYILKKILRSNFIINLLAIGIPLSILIYFSLPFLLGREDILTSFVGRINILKDISNELFSLFIPLQNFGLFTNLYQSYGESLTNNISDSTVSSVFVQYGLIFSIVFFAFIFFSFLKVLFPKFLNIKYLPMTILPFLPIFLTSNIFENYVPLYSFLICFTPSKIYNLK